VTNEELVKRYQDGDYIVLDELTRENMGLDQFVANKFSIHCSFIDYDDLIQQGWEGSFRAVQTYRADHPKSAKFSTWVIFWIRQAIHRYLEQKTPKDEISLYEPIGEVPTLADTIEDPEALQWLYAVIERRDLQREMEEVMDERLSLKQRQILKLAYGWDDNIPWSFAEIGRLFDGTRQGIGAAHDAAIKKLRRSPWGRKRIKEHLQEEMSKRDRRNPNVSVIIKERFELLQRVKNIRL